ncbi:MAG TPA: ATP-binding cassette domain-containing protein [Acetobacteraceae bacterium]|nr:ATP-binding cassette domain-containing protein [Acetobacteraceae bacterium]
MSAITVRDLRKQFRYAKSGRGLRNLIAPQYTNIDALGGISFTIAPGERVALIGPNGAGKSTTLKILTGILLPSGGNATVLGLTPWQDRMALARRIGVVFGQRPQLWSELPVRQSFALLRRIYAQDAAPFATRLDALSERFDLAPLMAQPVNRLSLGQRMRCEVVASLLHKPDVLFLDEPTIGLDITAKTTIRDLINAQAQSDGLTVVLTSHDTRDIELVCERVIVVNAGRIVVDQATETLRRRFLARKLVTLRSAAPAITLDLPGVSARPAEPHIAMLDVDTRIARIDSVVAAALSLGGIEDITIEDPPMEEVIHEIYAAASAR